MLQRQRTSLAPRTRRNEHRCAEKDPLTGLTCGMLFTRAWNLKRHQRDQHRDQGVRFLNYDPTSTQFNMTPETTTKWPTTTEWPRLPASNPPAPIAHMYGAPAHTTPTPWSPASNCPASNSTSWRTLSPAPRTLSPTPTMPASPYSISTPDPWTSSPTLPASPYSISTPDPWTSSPTPIVPASQSSTSNPISWRTLSPASRTPSPSPTMPAVSATTDSFQALQLERVLASNQHTQARPRRTSTASEATSTQSATSSEPITRLSSNVGSGYSSSTTDSEGSGCSCKKRKRSITTGRMLDAEKKDATPTYQVKRSKKTPGQQRGLDWLTAAGKAHFEKTYEMLLAQWGVKADHRGTCVLLPEDWKALDPEYLMTIFQDHKTPSGGSSRAWYAYSDHATSMARARGWYEDCHWPRTGVELDNFLGCGPYKPMDGSHLCHHEHCIIHLVHESAAINVDRWNCCLRARFLRQDGREVPEFCDQHSPPCMMQHAALTTREAYYIQFAVLRQAKGLPAQSVPRPRRYLYPTLESQVPSSSFPAITVSPDNLVEEVLPAKKEGRPDLLCAFCPCIKAYASITGFWSHVVNKHKEVNDEQRLREILRGAALWRQYWDQYSDGGKYANPTMAKLEQIEQQGESFGWQQVLNWGLR